MIYRQDTPELQLQGTVRATQTFKWGRKRLPARGNSMSTKVTPRSQFILGTADSPCKPEPKGYNQQERDHIPGLHKVGVNLLTYYV